MKRALCVLGLFWPLLTGAALAAPQCPFKPEVSVPITYVPGDGRPSIPVGMNGTEENLILDTGAPISIIKDAVVDALKLPLTPYPRTGVFPSGISPSAYATVDTLTVGALTGHKVRFYLVPTYQSQSSSGSFGADFLQGWDVDFDFGGKKLNFISPDQCTSSPVYWTAQAFTALPLRVGEDDQHLSATLKLDGKDVSAIIDTGAAFSVMGLALAAQVFDIHTSGDHTFKSMAFGDVSVDKPSLFIADGSRLSGKELLIGVPILKQLHLYVSYRRKTAYLTRADAH